MTFAGRLTAWVGRSGHETAGRRRPSRADGTDEPCIPCGQKAGVRPFSLNDAAGAAALADGARPGPEPDVLFTAVDGQVVLHDRSLHESHVLNPSAARVWVEMDGSHTVAEIIDDLGADAGVAVEVVDRDVRATLEWFVRVGIARVDPPPVGRATVDGGGGTEPERARASGLCLHGDVVERDRRVVIVAHAPTPAEDSSVEDSSVEEPVAVDPATLAVSPCTGSASPLGTLTTVIVSDPTPADGAVDVSVPVRCLLDLVGVTAESCFRDDAVLDHLARIAVGVTVVRLAQATPDDVRAAVDAALSPNP
jgi:hypothetical protein